jgi:glycosyltransferase involved in cell wall biosynthesis
LLQYMAVGLSALASPVGVNRDIVQHGQNGFLAANEADWYRHLAALCSNRELRLRIGSAARATVEAQYSLNVWGPALAERYLAIIGSKNLMYSRPPVAHSVVR